MIIVAYKKNIVSSILITMTYIVDTYIVSQNSSIKWGLSLFINYYKVFSFIHVKLRFFSIHFFTSLILSLICIYKWWMILSNRSCVWSNPNSNMVSEVYLIYVMSYTIIRSHLSNYLGHVEISHSCL